MSRYRILNPEWVAHLCQVKAESIEEAVSFKLQATSYKLKEKKLVSPNRRGIGRYQAGTFLSESRMATDDRMSRLKRRY